MTIITWNPICNFVIFVLLINCIKLPVASNWNPWKTECNQHSCVQFHPCIHPWKSKKLGSKTLIYGLKTILETKKKQIWLHEQNKCKPHQNIWNKVGFVVNSSLSPQGYVGSNFIMAKLVTFNGEKRG